MDISYLFDDRSFENEKLPSESELILSGARGRLFSYMLHPGGNGRHPAILLLHGFPGNEQNLDLAQSLRRIGFHVLTFHYSGSWGSDGEFSFSNVIEDAEFVLRWLQSEETVSNYNIDSDKIYVIGHSMGGFAALHVAADCDGIAGAIAASTFDFGHMQEIMPQISGMEQLFSDTMAFTAQWLNTTGQKLVDEVRDNVSKFKLELKKEALSKVPLLLISGSKDDISNENLNSRYLYDIISSENYNLVHHISLPCGHCFSDRRIEFINIIAKQLSYWMEK